MEGLAQAVVASTLYIPSLSSIIIVHSYASVSWLITLQYNINVIVSDNDKFFTIKYKSPGLLFGLVVGHPKGAGDGCGDAGHSGAGHGGGSGTAGGSGSTSAGCEWKGVGGYTSSSDSSSKHPTLQVHIIRHEKDSTNNAEAF